MSRPRIHKNEAERQAAFRAKHFRMDITLTNETGETITNLVQKLDVSKNALIESMIKFALTNRNWELHGLTHGKK